VGDQRRGRDLRWRAAGADHVHSFNVGLVLGLKAFPAAVLGGFGSIPGAVVGGVLIGVIEKHGRLLSGARVEGRRALHRSLGGVAAQAGRPVRPSHAQEV